MATTAYPGQSNTFVPNVEASNGLLVDYSRNPDSFALNKYIQIQPVSQSKGYYLEMNVEEAGRVLNANLGDHVWPDGQPRPSVEGNTEKHAFKLFDTERYHYGFAVGYKGAEQATWDVLGHQGRMNAQKAMTARTMLVHGILATGLTQTSAVSAISGVSGKWDVSTTARKDIKRSLDYAIEQILLNSLGGSKFEDLILVMAPGCARKISVCQEIVDHIKGSPDALNELKGNLGPNSQYGLPTRLYGLNIVIEDAVKVTNRRGGTKTPAFVMADTVPMIVSRPGALNSPTTAKVPNAAPSFSTITLMTYEDMTVETKADDDDRRHEGRIVDDIDPIVTAPISGFRFTAAVD
jgi:hypothetical protein